MRCPNAMKALSVVMFLSGMIPIAGCRDISEPSNNSSVDLTPIISVVNPIRELGVIRLSDHEELFDVMNTGTSNLDITELRRSCSCTQVEIDHTRIPPGMSAKIKLTISPKQAERRSASVTIHSNDPERPSVRLSLDWTSRGAVSVDTDTLNFGVVRPDIEARRTIHVTRDLKEIPGTCTTIFRSNPSGVIRAELKGRSESSVSIVETWDLIFRSQADLPNSTGRVYLTFDGSDQGGVAIPMEWKLRPPVEATPKSLYLGVGTHSTQVNATIDISSDPGTVLRVARVENVDRQIEFESTLEQITPETARIKIQARMPDKDGSHVGEIQIVCESPAGVTIKIPIVAVVRSIVVP